jgi:hypothetical protein
LFRMAYTKKDGSSSWPCCSWTSPPAGASRTLDGVRCRCLPRLRLRPRPPGHRKRDLSGLKAHHGVAVRSPLLPPKHLHRVRRCDDRSRGVADMAAVWTGLRCSRVGRRSPEQGARSRRAPRCPVVFVEL